MLDELDGYAEGPEFTTAIYYRDVGISMEWGTPGWRWRTYLASLWRLWYLCA